MGTQLLRYSNGYKYQVNCIKANKTIKNYPCVKRASMKCSASAHYIVNSHLPTIAKLTGEHIHGADVMPDYVRGKGYCNRKQ